MQTYNDLLIRYGKSKNFTNFTYFQAKIFDKFLTNCSSYVASLVIKDQVLA